MLLVLGLVLAASLPVADHADAPALRAGDSWRYKNITELQGKFSETHDESSVERLEGDVVLLRVHQVDSTLQPTEVLVGTDWARSRSVDGKEQVVNRPFDFPLVPAKTWTVEYSEDEPNRNLAHERFAINYRVVGTEQVTVPAGTFSAIKIEATGRWTATTAPSTTGVAVTRSDDQGAAVVNRVDRRNAREVTGRLYKAFWYAPEVKRAVKMVEEFYNTAGQRSERRESDLEAFNAGK